MLKLSEQLDALLPQTQCGLCTYQGCKPYAEALAAREAPINLCPPGGIETLEKLGLLLGEDPTPYLAEMKLKQKAPQLAVIREDECIGCTKCIQACPLDAIIGAAKQMHSILNINCSGCELCIAPCPVDCIDLIPLAAFNANQQAERQERFRGLYETHQRRIAAKTQKESIQAHEDLEKLNLSVDARLAGIKAARERAKRKKDGS